MHPWTLDQCRTNIEVKAWVSIIDINSDIKEPICVNQNCNTNEILIFGGYLKVKKIFVHSNLRNDTL